MLLWGRTLWRIYGGEAMGVFVIYNTLTHMSSKMYIGTEVAIARSMPCKESVKKSPANAEL